MLPESWRSSRLRFAAFEPGDADLAKSIYDESAYLKDKDPHFGEYPLSEFQSLIDRDCSGAPREGGALFFMRCIFDAKSNRPLGYLQFELDAPEHRQSWLPMFVLRQEAQGKGVGKEAVESLIATAFGVGNLDSIGLNVYAENRRALRFWFLCGWKEILGIDIEELEGQEYTCVTLLRRFA